VRSLENADLCWSKSQVFGRVCNMAKIVKAKRTYLRKVRGATNALWRVVNTHMMPYLYRLFCAKSSIIGGSSAEGDLQLKRDLQCGEDV